MATVSLGMVKWECHHIFLKSSAIILVRLLIFRLFWIENTLFFLGNIEILLIVIFFHEEDRKIAAEDLEVFPDRKLRPQIYCKATWNRRCEAVVC